MTNHRLPLLTLCAALLPACAPGELADDPIVIEEGKADDYRSTMGREYDLGGEVRLTLTAAELALEAAAREQRLAERVKALVDRAASALESKLNEIWPEASRDSGNVVVMLRAASPGSLDLEALGDGAYRFSFKAQVAGSLELLAQLPLEGPATRRVLGLTLAAAGDDPEQRVELVMRPAPAPLDAYPRYRELFKDGLDIALHVGGDHYTPRNDLDEARAIFDELKALGLNAPVDRFEDLALDSGPFRGELDANGTPVEVRVTLVHADLAAADAPEKLVDAYKSAAKNADVVIYRGHAGTSLSYSGVVVRYQPTRVAIPASEFKSLELPDKYQVFVFDGCETYTGYADKLYEHPKKNVTNLEVMTSVNYGSSLGGAETVRALVRALLRREQGTWFPSTWDALLKRVNDAKRGAWLPIYGVHGISDNPKSSPFGDPASVGKACTSSDECPGIDNLCVRPSATSSKKVCGIACTDSSGCPSGSSCKAVSVRADQPVVKQCVR